MNPPPTPSSGPAPAPRPAGDLPLVRTPRIRTSPFFESSRRAGMTGVTVYNHMILPAAYSGGLEEYRALVEGVTIWDVAGERQVEIEGPDALRLTQYLCTRDAARLKEGQARYTFICNHEGGILNDPVLLRVGEDRYWLSLADRDILLWAQAIAWERGFDAAVREPDVSPLQVQGPKSRPLIEDVFGPEISGQPYYRCAWTSLEGMRLLVSRTGWSGEYGYEVFLTDRTRGEQLWELLFEAGRQYGVLPAAPSQIRRIEGGILSYGTDMDDSVNPFELGMGRLVDFAAEGGFAGRAALRRIAEQGAARLLTGVRIEGGPIPGNPVRWPVFWEGGQVGELSSAAYSPRFGANLGFVLVERSAAAPGTRLEVSTEGGVRSAVTETLPFAAKVT